MADSVIDREAERMRTSREAEDRRQAEINASVAKGREAARREFEDSDAGAVSEQIRDAEETMRLPTPDAHRKLGSAVGDPLKGPSS